MITPTCNRSRRKSTNLAPAILLIALTIVVAPGCGDTSGPATDFDTNQTVSRIITLAPHLTELVYAAGAGDRLVGVVEYSDFPPQAENLPRVGDSFRLDHERVASLAPDLVLVWRSGTPLEVQERLHEMGFNVVAMEPSSIEDIGRHLIEIGKLAGTLPVAQSAADAFEARLVELRAQYSNRQPIDVFYQISARPLFTVTGRHVISEAIEICGGNNIFADVEGLSPAISAEAVILAAPEVIIAGRYATSTQAGDDPLEVWRRWQSIPAVRDGNLLSIDASLMARSSTRILDGVEELCGKLDSVRDHKMMRKI